MIEPDPSFDPIASRWNECGEDFVTEVPDGYGTSEAALRPEAPVGPRDLRAF